MSKQATGIEGKVLVIERIFDAPRERVWKAWTDAESAKRWWGPKDFTAPFSRIDFRVGGTYLLCMRAPDGKDYWSTGVYKEIEPMERIVATDSFADEKGNVVSAAHYGMSPDFPLELEVTVTFEDRGDKTAFTLHHAGLPPEENLDDMRTGWNQSLDKFADILK
ncbi:MAG: SRPBCC domain-containing protein [Spirochaetes bacterium]|nr:MAG: SRPBCC domain-containing protein [Spirochaetota bacterium]